MIWVICVSVYLLVAWAWWGINSAEARRQLGFAREQQAEVDKYAAKNQRFWGDSTNRARTARDQNLDEARAAAVDARRALYWLPWTLYGATRSLAQVNREVTEIHIRATELDPIQRADRLRELEAETEKLRKEQEKEST